MSRPEEDVPPVPPMPVLLPRPGPPMPAHYPSERATHLSSLRSLSGQAVRPVHPPEQPVVPPPMPVLPPSAASRYLRPQDLRRFENFQFAAKMVVEGFYSGRHRSPFHDRSAEFSDYRPYVPGDEIRSLDWRAYARTDRDYIKLFRKETDMRCHVLLDTSRSMAFRDETALIAETRPRPGLFDRLLKRTPPSIGTASPPPDTARLSKFEYGAYLTAGLCYLMIQQGDKASLALGASGLTTFVPPGGTITHLHGMLSHLERTQPEGETALANAVRGLFALTRRRGLLVVVSDFLEEPEPLFDALAMYTYRGWQILLLHVLTETELNLPGSGPQHYLDAETPATLDADPDSLREAYQSELQIWLHSLETQTKARGIHYSRMTTATPYDQALERYLTARQ